VYKARTYAVLNGYVYGGATMVYGDHTHSHHHPPSTMRSPTIHHPPYGLWFGHEIMVIEAPIATIHHRG
jgi:hypothetical protein